MTRHDSIRAVTGTTRLFGCIASPTEHVRAPIIFNRIFAERNIDAVMVPVDIPAEQLSEGIKGLKTLGNFKGAAVTIPHKLNLAALCDELGPGARATAAVNAVRFAGGATRTRKVGAPFLCTSGPYSKTRNPLYWGNIIIYLGVALLGGGILMWELFTLVGLFFIIQYYFTFKVKFSII